MAVHFVLEGSLLHQDSDEARRLRAKEGLSEGTKTHCSNIMCLYIQAHSVPYCVVVTWSVCWCSAYLLPQGVTCNMYHHIQDSSSFSTQSNHDVIFLMCSETATVDAGADPDEEKPETPVKICFIWHFICWTKIRAILCDGQYIPFWTGSCVLTRSIS